MPVSPSAWTTAASSPNASCASGLFQACWLTCTPQEAFSFGSIFLLWQYAENCADNTLDCNQTNPNIDDIQAALRLAYLVRRRYSNSDTSAHRTALASRAFSRFPEGLEVMT